MLLSLVAAITAHSFAAPTPLVFGCGSEGIAPTTSFDDLRTRFGAENVVVARIELGEGETAPGVVLFPNDPRKHAEITWYDTTMRRFPSMLRVRGEHSAWVARGGITLGTSLADLERVNHHALFVFGFGFDGAGTIPDWGGGRLADSVGSACTLRAAVAPHARTAAERRAETSFGGDTLFSSATVRVVHPRVERLWLDYVEPRRAPGDRRRNTGTT